MAPSIPLLGTDETVARGEAVGVPAELAELNVFRALLHRPAAAKALSDLLLSMLFGGALDDRLRELAIMRIGWATGSDYEWTQHWLIAQDRFGLSADDLLAVREWEEVDGLGAADRAVLAATDEILADGMVSAPTLARCRDLLDSDAAVVELVLVLGAWRTISQVTRTLDIPLEEGVASWPPDGRAGPG